jgi:hypothetical protein
MTEDRDPTPEEIQRVKAWQERKSTEDWSKYQRRREEIEEAAHKKLSGDLVGRRIEAVEGDQDHANWRTITLVLEGGVKLSIEYSSYSDPPELSVEVTGL